MSILLLLNNINSSYNYDYSIDLYFSISLLLREFFSVIYLTWKNKGDRIRSGLVGEIFCRNVHIQLEHGQGKEVKNVINKNPDIKQNKLLSTMIFYYFISRDGIAHGTRGEVMRCRVNIWEANTINVMIIIIVIVLFYIIFSTCTHMHCTEMRIICVWVIECSC